MPFNRDDYVSDRNFSRHQPYWLCQAKRLFPHPLFAGCISLACLLVGILFAGVAINVVDCWPMGIPSVLFFGVSIATAFAAFTPSDKEPRTVSGNVQTNKPPFAILVLLIGVYSWLLTLAMHIRWSQLGTQWLAGLVRRHICRILRNLWGVAHVLSSCHAQSAA